ncbi:hypothetical protein [Arcticibacterium luteifluviistationis]|uniref:Uncharacterized protein n=1 Tax=Arcticibacterium luteifluviistationis TaxID=1784714 RepID=A0A2Z4GGC0_9BACT|nr:hypothetical protein [Arcticibacterium luteifluviistationis]AWW00096.1 hypothetical protein DJ013_18745 [Arcticibacterium luteifluviistationis]
MNKEPKFKPTFGDYISNTQALDNEKAFIAAIGEPDAVRSQFYGSDILQEMLNRDSVVGIRFSYGINENNIPNIILTPIDTYGDIVNKPTNGGVGDDGDNRGGYGPTCPEFCE